MHAASRLLRATVATITLMTACSLAAVAPAGANSSIEGVWSYNGGKVAIHPGPEGTLVGTVVEPTRFAECTHPAGEEMWTDIRPQPNGSYWGFHHWFYETPQCALNPNPGPTAWRVMEAANGVHYLLVCFSSPEKPTQPTIGPNGETADVSYRCYGSEVESAHIAPLPQRSTPASHIGAKTFSEAVSLPTNKQCLSHRVLHIHLNDPKYDPLKKVVVTLRKRRIAVERRGNVFVATVDLKGLPRGAFTVKISVTTVLGYHFSGSRTYHTCVAKRKTSRSKSPKPAGHKHG